MEREFKQRINRKKVSDLCKEMKITQTKMISELGINENTYKQCMNQRKMSPPNIRKIANYLNVSPEYLMDETEEKNPGSRGNEEEIVDEWVRLIGIFQNLIDEKHPLFPKGYIALLGDLKTIFENNELKSFKNSANHHIVHIIQNAIMRDYEHLWFQKARAERAVKTGDEELLKRIATEFQDNEY